MVPLGEVAQVNPRLDRALCADQEVSFAGMADMSETSGSLLTPSLRSYAEIPKGLTPFQRDDLLIAKITPCFENGKIGRASISTELGFGSTEFHVVRPIQTALDSGYLRQFLRRPHFRLAGELRMTGSAGQRRVPASYVSGTLIPLSSLDEQRRIAAILDKADDLRAKRHEALARLDTLTQSIFEDLFGDPAINRFHWPMLALGDISTKFSDGPFGSNLKSSHYVKAGVRVIRLQNIGVGELLDTDKAFISEEHFQSLIKHECLPGDLLVGTLGDPNLRAIIQPGTLPRALNKADCVQIRINQDLASTAYVCALLNMRSTERMAQGLVLGQTRGRISMGRLKGLRVPMPPLTRQKEFDSRVAALERLKEHHRTQLAHLDTLFASLQHRAFKGTL
ncbi:hypothetical protein GCM10027403_07990 [Arthrobacter tecti]